MPVRSRRVVAVAGAGLVLLFASCDKSPTSPRPPRQPGPPPMVSTVRIELLAPPEIAPDETVQLTANATKSDGSVENVSSQAQWTSATSEVLQLGSTGLATGRNRGEVFVTVRFGGLSATARIIVLPKGTFRLSGTVHEGGFVYLENVTVTVTSGVGEGLTAVTNVDGGYVLYGVSGLVKLHARREGYVDVVDQVPVTAHRDQFFLMMVPNRPLVDLRGTYTLTISTQSACPLAPRPFPDAARRRSYTANVTQDGGWLSVVLTGADFIVHDGDWNDFVGRVTSTGEVRFYISPTYYDYGRQFDIAERFGDTALLIRGNVSTKATPELISGTLEGEILIAQGASPPFESYSSRCPAALFEMVRR